MRFPVPAFTGRRLLFVASGAVTAVQLPFWLNWLTTSYPDLETRVVLTTSAARFVSPHAVAQLTGAPPLPDRWPEDPVPGAPHVELARWCDTAVVFPACLHFLSRLALGLADTPALLALHCLTAPIGLAPSLPPGADRNPIVRDNLARLADRENVVVAPTTPARSLTTGHKDAAGSCPLWTLLELVEARRGDEPCSS